MADTNVNIHIPTSNGVTSTALTVDNNVAYGGTYQLGDVEGEIEWDPGNNAITFAAGPSVNLGPIGLSALAQATVSYTNSSGYSVTSGITTSAIFSALAGI